MPDWSAVNGWWSVVQKQQRNLKKKGWISASINENTSLLTRCFFNSMMLFNKQGCTLYCCMWTMEINKKWTDWKFRSWKKKSIIVSLLVKILAYWQNPSWETKNTKTRLHSFLLYFDLGNKENLNWWEIERQRNLKKGWISASCWKNTTLMTKSPLKNI